MPRLKPFAGIEPPLAWLRGVLLAATGISLLASAPLWINVRVFPVLPLASGIPVLPAPWDIGFFAAMLAALVLAVWFYRPAVVAFLVLGFFAFLEDQNRAQPWFYMFWVMLLLTLFPNNVAWAACRWSVAIVYLWSGFQKCSPHFFNGEPAWFIEPATHWHLPVVLLDALRWSVASAPFLEIGIAFGLWFRRTRPIAIAAVVLVHGAALLFLGPLGRNYNWIVWPWNLAMIALGLVLFRKNEADARNSLVALGRSKTATGLIALYSLLPILSYWGLWDSYFSFALYAENAAQANIFVTPAFADRLPPHIRSYVRPFAPNYDPQFQGPSVLLFSAWCYEDLHVIFIPEPRVYRTLYKSLRQYALAPEELRLMIGPRYGPVQFYEGDRRLLLTPR